MGDLCKDCLLESTLVQYAAATYLLSRAVFLPHGGRMDWDVDVV